MATFSDTILVALIGLAGVLLVPVMTEWAKEQFSSKKQQNQGAITTTTITKTTVTTKTTTNEVS